MIGNGNARATDIAVAQVTSSPIIAPDIISADFIESGAGTGYQDPIAVVARDKVAIGFDPATDQVEPRSLGNHHSRLVISKRKQPGDIRTDIIALNLVGISSVIRYNQTVAAVQGKMISGGKTVSSDKIVVGALGQFNSVFPVAGSGVAGYIGPIILLITELPKASEEMTTPVMALAEIKLISSSPGRQ